MRFPLLIAFLALIALGCSPERKIDFEKHAQELEGISGKLESDFVKIRKEVEQVAGFTKSLYEKQDKTECRDTSIYKMSEQGVLYKVRDDGGSAVFVSGAVPVNQKIKDIVCFTEPLDSVFKEVVGKYPAVVQAYYNDRYNYNRIYPFFNVLNQYQPGLKIPEFNFYYLADEGHNPEKEGVWVNEPYVDPAGRGWMISAIAPVYYKQELVGVPGMDVTISTILDRYLTEGHENIFIVDKMGVMVLAKSHILNELNLPDFNEYKYFETIKADTYKKQNFNMLKHKSKEVRDAMAKIITNGQDKVSFKYENFNYYFLVDRVDELDWYVIKMIRF